MQDLGVEISFNNFQIDFPLSVGTVTGKTFDFSKDLLDIKRSWSKSNGTTYSITIANLFRTGNYPSEEFSIGDTVIINDELIGDSFEKRIIQYQKCHDNPTKDAVTLGVYVRDSSTNAVANSVTLNNTVQQDEQYSNVSIGHANGFMAINSAGDLRVIENAIDCFACQVLVGGEWKTLTELTYQGVGASKLYNPLYTGLYPSYAKIGEEQEGSYSLPLVLYTSDIATEGVDTKILQIRGTGDNTSFENESETSMHFGESTSGFYNGLNRIGFITQNDHPAIELWCYIAGNPNASYLSLDNDGRAYLGGGDSYIEVSDSYIKFYVNGVLKETWS